MALRVGKETSEKRKRKSVVFGINVYLDKEGEALRCKFGPTFY
jgi:hypothetical protein